MSYGVPQCYTDIYTVLLVFYEVFWVVRQFSTVFHKVTQCSKKDSKVLRDLKRYTGILRSCSGSYDSLTRSLLQHSIVLNEELSKLHIVIRRSTESNGHYTNFFQSIRQFYTGNSQGCTAICNVLRRFTVFYADLQFSSEIYSVVLRRVLWSSTLFQGDPQCSTPQSEHRPRARLGPRGVHRPLQVRAIHEKPRSSCRIKRPIFMQYLTQHDVTTLC